MNDDIKFSVSEEDLTGNDFIGDASLKIETLCGKDTDLWFDIIYEKTKKAGQVHIRTKYTPISEIISESDAPPVEKKLDDRLDYGKKIDNAKSDETKVEEETGDIQNGGTLKIEIVGARLTRNTEGILGGKMDPYLEVKTPKGLIYKTQTK